MPLAIQSWTLPEWHLHKHCISGCHRIPMYQWSNWCTVHHTLPMWNVGDICSKQDICSNIWVQSKAFVEARLLKTIIWIQSKTFVELLSVGSKSLLKHFGWKAKTFVPACWLRSKTFHQKRQCEARLFTNILAANQDFCWNVCGSKKDFCTNIWSANKDFCSIILDAKQDFCFKILGLKQDFCSNIKCAKQDFCSNILGAKEDFFQTFLMQSKTFVQTFVCKARLLLKTF